MVCMDFKCDIEYCMTEMAYTYLMSRHEPDIVDHSTRPCKPLSGYLSARLFLSLYA